MQRVLIGIPHFFDRSGVGDARHDSAHAASAEKRAQALSTVICKLHELFAQPYLVAQHTQQNCVEFTPPDAMQLDIYVITMGENHLLEQLTCPPSLYRRGEASGNPRWLGLAVHKLIAQKRGEYAWYGYLEDDTAIEDPLFFYKLRKACDVLDAEVGPDAMLQPARYETVLDASTHNLPAPRRLYPDWECSPPYFEGPNVTIEMLGRPWTLEPARHPHAGCFFLDQRRAELFVRSGYCGQSTELWVTPPDTSASYGIMRTFRIYKAARDSLPFLEVRHLRPAMINALREIAPGTYTWKKKI